MTPLPFSVQDILHYLTIADPNFSPSLRMNSQFDPWVLVRHVDSIELAARYKKQKPPQDLAALKKESPARYARLLQGLREEKELQQYKYANPTTRQLHREENPDLYARADELVEFRKQSTYGFRPADFPESCGDPLKDWSVYLSHALYRNTEDSTCLALTLDSRENNLGLSAVKYEIFDGAGQTQKRIIHTAQNIWTDQLLRTVRFYPFTMVREVEGMKEAERLRGKFAKAADREDLEPARPKNALFKIFPAFMRAYHGENGFFHALNDIYGRDGNHAYLAAEGPERSYRDASPRKQYEVNALYFVDLYAKMSNRDRGNFEAALDKFIAEQLPGKPEIEKEISFIKTVVDFGPGIMEAVDFLNHLTETERAMKRIVNGKEPRAPSLPKGPLW